MKNILRRFVSTSLLVALVVLSGICTIAFFPEPLFAHKLEHAPFSVYSNEPIDERITIVLDSATNLVHQSELYDDDYTFDVFLSYNTFYNIFDDKILGRGPSARATDNNVIVKVAIDVHRSFAFPTFYERCETNLVRLIAHEMMHCLQENEYGKVKFNPFNHPPYWKLEGYPEYISRQLQRDSQYSLVEEINRYLYLEKNGDDFWLAQDEGGCKSPKYYFKSRLMTEYLMDVKFQTYDQILFDTAGEDEIFNDMIRWKEQIESHATDTMYLQF
jgi:hypothetical protein